MEPENKHPHIGVAIVISLIFIGLIYFFVLKPGDQNIIGNKDKANGNPQGQERTLTPEESSKLLRSYLDLNEDASPTLTEEESLEILRSYIQEDTGRTMTREEGSALLTEYLEISNQ